MALVAGQPRLAGNREPATAPVVGGSASQLDKAEAGVVGGGRDDFDLDRLKPIPLAMAFAEVRDEVSRRSDSRFNREPGAFEEYQVKAGWRANRESSLRKSPRLNAVTNSANAWRASAPVQAPWGRLSALPDADVVTAEMEVWEVVPPQLDAASPTTTEPKRFDKKAAGLIAA